MRKIFIILFLISSFLFQIDNSFAASGDSVKVRVTEKIPGVTCKEVTDKNGDIIKAEDGAPALYDCEVEKGATQIVKMLGNIIKYFTYIASLVGVLFIVYNGILYSMGGADPSLKDDAKKRIIGTLIGLILLLLSGPILKLIAPWIFV
ncbi:MAG: hypothetical protein PHV23_03725 [Candidatus Gracilibacteria bacterium]|nr:hypothetical protein [Candidatus Gracilibacteria bacterium]